MTDLFLDILDKNRQEVFSCLGKFSGIGVLAGGTAIALQIGHRQSVDFDIFTNKPLPANLWDKARRVFGPGCVQTMNLESQLNFQTSSGISITFFYMDYPPLFPLIKTKSVDLFDLKDLSTNKAYTIGRRGRWRDYVDLYFLLKEKHITIEEVISLSQKRYRNEFPTKLFLEQLCYFDDIDGYEIKFCHEEISPEIIKNFLIIEAKKITAHLAIS